MGRLSKRDKLTQQSDACPIKIIQSQPTELCHIIFGDQCFGGLMPAVNAEVMFFVTKMC